MATFIKCLLGPRLVRVYASNGNQALNYEPNGTEKLGDNIVQLMNKTLQVAIYVSPFIVWMLYKKNCFSNEGIYSLMRVTVFCTAVCATSLATRAFGRIRNQEYVSFINNLDKVRISADSQKILSRYDFDFWAWPVEFKWKDVGKDADKPRLYIESKYQNRSITDLAKALPCQLIGYIVANTIGIRLLYPGTILQYFIGPHLIDGRSRMVEENKGRRCKLETRDGNYIDTMFVDRRSRPEFPNGDILVVCCEGNAGFYEVGMAVTPLEAGYSVLGWNHPGFGGSTGSPFPSQEQNAVDVVMQFALHRLNFPPERIVIYGWSIGGFTASWAAMNYPNVRAVILDATFDHVYPLAANVMPNSWKPLVSATVKHQLNLSVAEQIMRYPGPVLLFRRSRDEIISLEPGTLASNRGNDLLLKLLKFRFPHIVDEVTTPVLREWLSADVSERVRMLSRFEVSDESCLRELQKYTEEHTDSFPMRGLGESWIERQKVQMALFLAGRYMLDFDSNHCTPLPASMFRSPRHIGLESDFVEVTAEDVKTIKRDLAD